MMIARLEINVGLTDSQATVSTAHKLYFQVTQKWLNITVTALKLAFQLDM